MSEVVTAFIDLIVEESPLGDVDRWIEIACNPPSRNPSDRSKAVASAFGRISRDEAKLICRAAFDSMIFSFFASMDSDFKNSGLHATLQLGDEKLCSEDAFGIFVETYRMRVEPDAPESIDRDRTIQ